MTELSPQIAWVPPGKPSWHPGGMNPCARGLELALGHLGHAAPYDEVMADLGLAFITQGEVGSARLIEGAVDVGWWPLEPLYLLRLGLLEQAVGREIRAILPPLEPPAQDVDGGAADLFRAYFEAPLRQALDRGAPAVVRLGASEVIVTGLDSAPHPLMGLSPNVEAHRARVVRLEQPLPPALAIVLGERRTALPRPAADREALRYAVALIRDEVLGGRYVGPYPLRHAERFGPTWRTGQQSLRAWQACLESAHPGRRLWHVNQLGALGRQRASAARFLRAARDRHTGAAQAALGEALAAYEAMVALAEANDSSEQAWSTRRGIAFLSGTLRRWMPLELRAAEALERAVAAMG
jgi:hypothetical protein